MKCPKCAHDNLKVVEKRNLPGEDAIRRRRECGDCHFRFTTYERVEVPLLMVLKKSGTTEPYLRDKMAAGFYKALEKRPFVAPEIEKFVDEVDREIQVMGLDEVPTTFIGDLVTSKLKATDEVAYLRFVSVYRAFDDLSSFKKELDKLTS